jgi:hypothetical protein
MAIRVYDWEGKERDLAYLKARYGEFIIRPAAAGDGPAYKIVVLREKVNTAATLVVQVVDGAGRPLEGVRVAWYWPDAPPDPHAGPQGGGLPQMAPNRAVNGLTNLSGDVGFGLGHGAFYWPNQGQIGPHATWAYGTTTRSDLILGLGMLAATNHDHFDVQFARVDEEQPPEPTVCPGDEIRAELVRIEQAVQAIRNLLEDTGSS